MTFPIELHKREPLQVDSPKPLAHSAVSKRRILSGIATLAGGEIGARFIAFAATAWLTRRLGPEAYGIVGFATGISAYFLIVANTGLNDIGTREVAREPHAAADIAASAIAVRLMLAVAAWCALAIVAVLLPKTHVVRLVVFLAGLSFITQALDASWVFKGLERTTRVGTAAICSQSLYTIGVLSLVRGPDDVVWVPILQAAGELSAAVWIGTALFRHRWPKVTLERGLRIMRDSGFVTASRLLRVVILTGGVVLLGLIAGETAVGFFTASYRYCFLLMAIAAAIATAFLPAFARTVPSPDAFVRLARSALSVSAIIGAPLVFGSVVTAATLLPLMFGPAYIEATLTFQILLVSIGFVFLHGPLHNAFLVLHRTHVESVLFGVAALLMLLLSVTLIPSYGHVGAAVAVASAEALIALAGWVVLARSGVSFGIRPITIPLAAAATMSAVLFLLPPLRLPFTVVIGAATYILALTVMGGVPRGIWSLVFRHAP